MKYSIVIPIYNSEKSILLLYERIKNYFEKTKETYEIIFVEDDSKDDSPFVLGSLLKDERVSCLFLSQNVGQQKAVQIGLCHAKGDFAVTLDDDLQHDIGDLARFEAKINAGADLVFGIYDNHGTNLIRRMGSFFVGHFFKKNFPHIPNLRVSSYRVIGRSLYLHLKEVPYDFVYVSALLLPHAQNVSHVHICRHERNYGKSGYNFFKLFKITIKLYVYYGHSWLRLFRRNKKHEAHVDVRRGGMPIQRD